jgi:hypothetical protein
MNTLIRTGAAAAALVLTAGASTAAEPVNLSRMTMGYNYFNRAGASVADHDKAVIDCSREALKVRSFADQHQVGLGIVGVLLSQAMADAANRGAFASALENCMVVRGWRVVSLPEAEGQALAKLKPDELAAKLSPWIGADAPHGEITRVWGNDAARASTTRYAIRPDHTSNGQLSLAAAGASPLANAPAPPAPPPPPKAQLDPKWPTRALKPDQLASAPAEGGVVIIELKGLSQRNGIGLGFARMGPEKDSFPSVTDHGPDVMNLFVGLIAAKREGNLLAVAAPAGRWRIAAMGMMPMLGFCLGGPSFELKPGEVVYAGAFDLSAEDLGPDMSLDAPKAWLGNVPAASTIRPAAWTNGAEGLCGYNDIYALEIKGAPFAAGYHWGGAAGGTQP